MTITYSQTLCVAKQAVYRNSGMCIHGLLMLQTGIYIHLPQLTISDSEVLVDDDSTLLVQV